MSRSYTSRAARAGEQDGVDYNFISRERFEVMIGEQAFLEWADVFGSYYGTSAADTDAALARGEDVVLVIDVQGARQVRSRAASGQHLRAAAVLGDSRAAAARPQQGQRRTDRAAARRARREVDEFSQYDYPSSTMNWTRRSSGWRPSSPPSAHGHNACGRRPKPS